MRTLITTCTLLAALGGLADAARADSGGHAHGTPHEGAAHAGDSHENEAHAAALGRPADPADATRTVAVTMDDRMRFTPDRIEVGRGETVRFLVTNVGALKHEMVLGSAAELREHAALMRRFPEMEHADPNAVSVAPGASAELAWTFAEPGAFDFACLAPGHLEAGMTGQLIVK